MRRIFLFAALILAAVSLLLLMFFGESSISDIYLTAFSGASSDGNITSISDGNGYLIIAPEKLLVLPEMAQFVSHKKQTGFEVQTASVENINKTFGLPDLADSIRKFLKDNQSKLGLRYLLLVGEPDPTDLRIKLPVAEDLPEFVVSAPSRSMGGTYASDAPDSEMTANAESRLVLLTGPNLQVLAPGTLRYWYVKCTAIGKLRFLVFRREGNSYRKIFASSMRNVTKTGIAFSATPAVELEKGDVLAFELPADNAVTVGAVKMPGTVCALVAEPSPVENDIIESSVFSQSIEELPLLQCSVYFEPDDRTGSVPSKMCWPMGTYNGVYGALLRDSCLSQCPTDAFYADLSGDWDANGNGFFGETCQKFFRYDGGAEPGELADGDFFRPAESFLPEILVGRIPFDDARTVAAILRKTISYETSGDREWRKSCLLGADPLSPDTDSYALCESIRRDFAAPSGFASKRYYTEFDFDGEMQSSKRYGYEPEIIVSLDEIKKDWSAGYEKFSQAWADMKPGMVVWSSHANTDICRNIITLRDESSEILPLPATRRYVEKLDDSHPAIVFAVSCSVTQQEPYYLGIRKKRTSLEHNWEPRPNVGRELLKNGAVAFVGPSRSIWFRHGWKSPEDGGCLTLAYDFSKRLVAGETVGISLAAALREYHLRWGCELADGENIIGFNIYGDPSLSLGVGKKENVPLFERRKMPVLISPMPTPDGEEIVIRTTPDTGVALEIGMVSEVGKIIAGAEGESQWFEYDGFQVSGSRHGDGANSYYSGTARHANSMLTMAMPLMPGQDLQGVFACWYQTEPGLDYVFFEKSSNGMDWSPLGVYSGVSSPHPLFGGKPVWRQESVEFSTGDTPAFVRFRYVTNDQYKKKPHEGFYMDNFALSRSDGKKVGYVSGWQKVMQSEESGVFALRNPGPGTYYLKAVMPQKKPFTSQYGLYRIVVSESRYMSWNEWMRTTPGLMSVFCGLAALLLLLFAFATPSGKKPQ